IAFNYFRQSRETEQAPLEVEINKKNQTQTVQAFAQWQFRPTDQVTINAGGHYMQLLYNNTSSIEPRASVKWQVNRKNSIALGYGNHSQLQALGVYFAQAYDQSGQVYQPNRNLDLTKAHHYIFSWQHTLARDLALKAEVYYQQLYNVPVSIYDSSSFSVLNIENDYVTDPLTNEGKGRNYGIELSLEKYLSKGLYYTASTSVYQSKYTAKDGVERNTRFNGNYTATLIAGKEFLSADNLRTFGINIKTIYAGGMRTTPIDLERSIQEDRPVFQQEKAFSLQNPSYFRTDLRLSLRWNRKHLTSTLSLDIQNISNRLNVYGQWFDSEQNKVVTTYQIGLIPVLNYKVEF
ncbi:MAG: TonB-dependent receptor domain-containing protein, partial [Flavisolibacter sp.]